MLQSFQRSITVRCLIICSSIWLCFILAVGGCGGNKGSSESTDPEPTRAGGETDPAGPAFEVVETMDSGGYTYALLRTPEGTVWTAGPVTSLEAGQKTVPIGAMEMRDFHSKTLDRTFDSIYFVQSFGSAGDKALDPHEALRNVHGGVDVLAGRRQIGPTAEDSRAPGARTVLDREVTGEIEPAPGGNTVAEIYRDKSEMSGKTVTVRGIVVKFTPGIMGTNWLHLQDGTGEKGAHDLTVMTDETVGVGDLITVSGVLALDRDFGAGYKYEVIIQGARVTGE